MNRLLARIGAGIVTASVFLFAVFLATDFSFGSYFVCMLLPVGYIMTAAGFQYESAPSRRVAANIGMALAAVYAVLILLVYFAQTTTVRVDDLSEEALAVLAFNRGGLIFDYDLLGYGMMALSTFFIGLSMDAADAPDRWLRRLMLAHGAFFPGCFIMPMTGMFSGMSGGGTSRGGVIALLVWCAYFLPVGVLAYRHFSDRR